MTRKEANERTASPREIKADYLIIVEGKDEEYLFGVLLVKMGINNLQIIPTNGKDNLRNTLKALLLARGFDSVKSIGIVRDADKSATNALKSVQDTLRDNKLPMPDKELTKESDKSGVKPCITILILPGKNKQGSLETLCMKSVADDPAAACVQEFVRCLKKSKRRIQLPTNIDKTRAYAFIASRKDVEDKIGVAAQKGHWNLDAAAFNQLKKFVRLVATGAD